MIPLPPAFAITQEQREELRSLPKEYLSILLAEIRLHKLAEEALSEFTNENKGLKQYTRSLQIWKEEQKLKTEQSIEAEVKKHREALFLFSNWQAAEQIKHANTLRALEKQQIAFQKQLHRTEAELSNYEQKLDEIHNAISAARNDLSHLVSKRSSKRFISSTIMKDYEFRESTAGKLDQFLLEFESYLINEEHTPVVVTLQKPKRIATNLPTTAIPIQDISTVIDFTGYRALEQMLLDPSYILINVLDNVISLNDYGPLASCLASIFHKKERTEELLKVLITEEVQKTDLVQTLFRGNSMTSKLLRLYTTSLGMGYLKGMLKDLVTQVIQKNENLEIDPLAEDEGKFLDKETCVQNCTKLLQLTNQFLDAIVNSIDSCPL